jgi:membrane-associated protease RseP (regulator of RpoE activity)
MTTKRQTPRRQQAMRLAIPAAVCLAALLAVAFGTRLWQATGQNQAQPMDLRGQWLGMRLAPTNSRSALDLGVPADVKGVVVADVQVSSRAVLAGLAPGDVVTRVDGKDVTSLVELYALSTKLDVARQLQVDILRAGRPMVVMVPPPDGIVQGAQGPQGVQGGYGARPAAGAVDNSGWGGSARPIAGCPNCPVQ